ncbi:hypothetical protein TYRP_002675 [Tyrophagus putrescentiae]|nr:hypothetical protein TYRP_002675 [Tyrophagus putrescentiae]
MGGGGKEEEGQSDGLGLLADTVLEDDAEDDLSVDPLGNARQRQHQTLENAHRTGLDLAAAAHRSGAKVDREAGLLDGGVLAAVDIRMTTTMADFPLGDRRKRELAGRRFDEVEELLDDEEEEEEDFFLFDDDELLLLLPFVEEDLLLLAAFSAFRSSFPSFAGDILRLKAFGLLVVTLVSSKEEEEAWTLVAFLFADC